nr:zinc-ribbon domain-containing protein [Leptospira vanthielii]
MNLVKQCPNCSTMLRFPATQGTILVQCPVCSHRFTFVPDLESAEDSQYPSDSIPSFQFQPSFQSYKELILDLLYAPIDYLKSKRGPKKREFQWIPILLFTILLLYFWKWSLPETQRLDVDSKEIQNQIPIPEEPNQESDPIDPQEESPPPSKPTYEI